LETAHRLSARMNGEPSTEITDLFIATIKEFGNIVCGGAVVRLDQLKRSFDLSPPTVILGEQMMLATESRSEILVIPFLSDLGQIDLNIFITPEKKA
ncbi:MAG: chemotaxis protein CheX, partial [Spirochaetia bacterium]|nr:chemotaxis protein CheX [Spirochaetia bacterium]